MALHRVRAAALAVTAILAVVALVGRVSIDAQEVPPPLFRIYLKDGTSLVSYGEYARVGDRVLFAAPLGQEQGLPRLQAASVPDADVDWAQTETYAASLRAERYFATRAQADFDALADAMQALLDELARTDDAKVKLAIAERVRNTLAAWPSEHHGYRTDEIRQMLALADDVVSELESTTGNEQFSLALVAIPMPPPRTPLLPAPTLQDSIEQVLRLSGFAASPAERILLLEAAHRLLEVDNGSLASPWRDRTLRNVVGAIEVEQRTTRNYGSLRDAAVERLNRLTTDGDVRGIERLIDDVRRRDLRLGGQRPDMMVSLLSTLERRLVQVRQAREDRDRAAARRKSLDQYLRAIRKPLDESRRLVADLGVIRSGDLLPRRRADDLADRLNRLASRLRGVEVPTDAATTHAAFTSATTLGRHAVALRSGSGGDPVQLIRDASAAAAGAILLFQRVDAEVDALASAAPGVLDP